MIHDLVKEHRSQCVRSLMLDLIVRKRNRREIERAFESTLAEFPFKVDYVGAK